MPCLQNRPNALWALHRLDDLRATGQRAVVRGDEEVAFILGQVARLREPHVHLILPRRLAGATAKDTIGCACLKTEVIQRGLCFTVVRTRRTADAGRSHDCAPFVLVGLVHNDAANQAANQCRPQIVSHGRRGCGGRKQ